MRGCAGTTTNTQNLLFFIGQGFRFFFGASFGVDNLR